jgi:hypothetical protein
LGFYGFTVIIVLALEIPKWAPIVTTLADATVYVLTRKVAEVDPAGMIRDGGPLAASGSDEPTVTVRPPLGAGPLRVIVPVPEAPPTRESGTSRFVKAGARTKIVRFMLDAPRWAPIVTVWAAATGSDLTLNVAEVAPAGMVIDCGPLATVGSEEPKVTVMSACAGALRVTLPTPLDPPVKLEGAVMEVSFGRTLSSQITPAGSIDEKNSPPLMLVP